MVYLKIDNALHKRLQRQAAARPQHVEALVIELLTAALDAFDKRVQEMHEAYIKDLDEHAPQDARPDYTQYTKDDPYIGYVYQRERIDQDPSWRP